VLTGQGIQLLGMPTEAIHTPLLQDRFLSIRSALYVFNTARDLGEQFEWREDSLVARFAGQILRDAVELLRKIDELGLFKGLEAGLFADIKRSPEGGRGLDGVIKRNENYFNPFYEELLAHKLR
jgi:beta-lysine 5,6-aminomutase alpha subunit